MSGIFEGYEREYCELATTVTRKTEAMASAPVVERTNKLEDINSNISEAEALIRRMDLEARSLPSTAKTPLLTKLREYKNELAKLKRESKKAAASTEGDRDELLSRAELGGSSSGASSSAQQRERLLLATDRVRATGDRIQQGKQTLLETEELGVSILQDLHKQRETIIHARENLHDTDDSIGAARRVLTTMSRRATTNKIILSVIVLLLIGAISTIVYFKIIK
mmetsp:Transcript_34533/g.41741  ORF Transcript_34533/g.41741 Transcript_34533/m.41741 type:complete len:224 (+) Transcript_34533:293-964(+)|eukprot:CAMPEP_0197858566 /NCGR_PEP_ID=MMETSP1438-20131217/32443_1 /TAXON_ID=1461541 /ORGANISM="Pterosperma sp., Strain CCMP1384" /LENGTH=223 /DNA_ID=CAMNT_0043474765 /DNA_START=292 /DNA_END=963 /DNA_ORIENTATION=+